MTTNRFPISVVLELIDRTSKMNPDIYKKNIIPMYSVGTKVKISDHPGTITHSRYNSYGHHQYIIKNEDGESFPALHGEITISNNFEVGDEVVISNTHPNKLYRGAYGVVTHVTDTFVNVDVCGKTVSNGFAYVSLRYPTVTRAELFKVIECCYACNNGGVIGCVPDVMKSAYIKKRFGTQVWEHVEQNCYGCR